MGASEDVWGPSPEEKRRQHAHTLARELGLEPKNPTKKENPMNDDKTAPAPIDLNLANLDDQLDRLICSLDNLYRKLAPVMGPDFDYESSSEPSAEMSRIASILDVMGQRVYDLGRQVEHMTDRVEL